MSNDTVEQYNQLAKVDLHAHMIFSAPFATYLKLSDHKVARPPDKFKGLTPFLNYLGSELVPWIKTKEDVAFIFNDVLEHMVSDGIVYTELSFDMRLALRIGANWSELLDLFQVVIAKHPAIKVAPDLGLARETPEEYWKVQAPALIKSGFFKAVDLYGQEDFCPAKCFNYYFSLARDNGLKIKIHSGEICEASIMLEDLKEIKPNVVQHGIKATTNNEVIDWLLKYQVPLNICPASNIALQLVDSYQNHPLLELLDKGVEVTIGSDDFTVFGISLSNEYHSLSNILTVEQLNQIRLNGLKRIN